MHPRSGESPSAVVPGVQCRFGETAVEGFIWIVVFIIFWMVFSGFWISGFHFQWFGWWFSSGCLVFGVVFIGLESGLDRNWQLEDLLDFWGGKRSKSRPPNQP